eukprot:887787_1
MEEGGTMDMFEYNKSSHQLINCGKMDFIQWRETVKYIFYKMCKFIHWLHNLFVCHLDISLENIIINKCNNNIRFIDFGHSEIFANTFLCNKCAWRGKLGYKAPNVYNNKSFMGNKADIYSLGICLFLLSIGAPPYGKPNETDQRFKIIKDGKIKELLKSWNRLHYVENEQLNL